MRRAVALLALILLALSVGNSAQDPSKRRIPCKTPAKAASCYWTHGRLWAGNGTPAYRLWKIGTKRILGIFSGPGAEKRDEGDNEHPEFPQNLKRAMEPSGYIYVFADFEVCPLEPERLGVMQSACIESAKNIVVGK